MEGLFTNERGAPLMLVGQPNMTEKKLDNPIYLPWLLNFLTLPAMEGRGERARRLSRGPLARQHPAALLRLPISLAGPRTTFVAVLALAVYMLWRGRLYDTPLMLWA